MFAFVADFLLYMNILCCCCCSLLPLNSNFLMRIVIVDVDGFCVTRSAHAENTEFNQKVSHSILAILFGLFVWILAINFFCFCSRFLWALARHCHGHRSTLNANKMWTRTRVSLLNCDFISLTHNDCRTMNEWIKGGIGERRDGRRERKGEVIFIIIFFWMRLEYFIKDLRAIPVRPNIPGHYPNTIEFSFQIWFGNNSKWFSFCVGNLIYDFDLRRFCIVRACHTH